MPYPAGAGKGATRAKGETSATCERRGKGMKSEIGETGTPSFDQERAGNQIGPGF